MAAPIIYGPSFGTYARTVRLVLEEKGVGYELKPVNIMTGEGQASEHTSRHPFANSLSRNSRQALWTSGPEAELKGFRAGKRVETP